MNEITYRQNKIKELVKPILEEDTPYSEIKTVIEKIYFLFHPVTDLTSKLEPSEHGTILPDGEALSPQPAAGCIFYFVRTTKFLRGIKKSIDNQINNLNKEKIKILYAGTGPFATLLLPLIPLYDENQLEICAIDIHQESLDALNSLISAFGFKDYFTEILVRDATAYENKSNNKFDIIISETMDKGLSKEPQVAITNHLSQYLSKDGSLVPEEIRISAVLADLKTENLVSRNKWSSFWTNTKKYIALNNRIFLKDIFILDKNVREKYGIHKLVDDQLPLISIIIPEKIGNIRNLMLLTEIKLYDDIILSEEDNTGLTKPYFDKEIFTVNPGMKLKFSYKLGSNPKFLIEMIDQDLK